MSRGTVETHNVEIFRVEIDLVLKLVSTSVLGVLASLLALQAGAESPLDKSFSGRWVELFLSLSLICSGKEVLRNSRTARRK